MSKTMWAVAVVALALALGACAGGEEYYRSGSGSSGGGSSSGHSH